MEWAPSPHNIEVHFRPVKGHTFNVHNRGQAEHNEGLQQQEQHQLQPYTQRKGFSIPRVDRNSVRTPVLHPFQSVRIASLENSSRPTVDGILSSYSDRIIFSVIRGTPITSAFTLRNILQMVLLTKCFTDQKLKFQFTKPTTFDVLSNSMQKYQNLTNVAMSQSPFYHIVYTETASQPKAKSTFSLTLISERSIMVPSNRQTLHISKMEISTITTSNSHYKKPFLPKSSLIVLMLYSTWNKLKSMNQSPQSPIGQNYKVPLIYSNTC